MPPLGATLCARLPARVLAFLGRAGCGGRSSSSYDDFRRLRHYQHIIGGGDRARMTTTTTTTATRSVLIINSVFLPTAADSTTRVQRTGMTPLYYRCLFSRAGIRLRLRRRRHRWLGLHALPLPAACGALLLQLSLATISNLFSLSPSSGRGGDILDMLVVEHSSVFFGVYCVYA